MHLDASEPAAGPWTAMTYADLATRVPRTADGRALVLVDGRSGAGKTTIATGLARACGGAVVHTDDVAWHLHPTDWADELVAGVLEPWRRGSAVSYRPPGWITKDRPGAVEVATGVSTLVVEGVGVGRAGLAERADLVLWVQSDRDEARRRGVDRDVELGRTRPEAEAFWDEWAASEDPFLAADRPWDRADLILLGTPLPTERASTTDGSTHAADTVFVAPHLLG